VEGDCAEQFLGKSRSPSTLPTFRESSVMPDKLSAPIQIVHGTADSAVAPVHSQLLYKRLQKAPGARARSGLLLIDGGGHMLPAPEHRDQAWRAACGFLDREIGPPVKKNNRLDAAGPATRENPPAQERNSESGL
jgi:hypothetical protein